MVRSADDVLGQEFLQTRAKLLEVAAFFDRLSEAGSLDESDERWRLLREGVAIVEDDQGDKAARLQLLFSRQYDAAWREKMSV